MIFTNSEFHSLFKEKKLFKLIPNNKQFYSYNYENVVDYFNDYTVHKNLYNKESYWNLITCCFEKDLPYFFQKYDGIEFYTYLVEVVVPKEENLNVTIKNKRIICEKLKKKSEFIPIQIFLNTKTEEEKKIYFKFSPNLQNYLNNKNLINYKNIKIDLENLNKDTLFIKIFTCYIQKDERELKSFFKDLQKKILSFEKLKLIFNVLLFICKQVFLNEDKLLKDIYNCKYFRKIMGNILKTNTKHYYFKNLLIDLDREIYNYFL